MHQQQLQEQWSNGIRRASSVRRLHPSPLLPGAIVVEFMPRWTMPRRALLVVLGEASAQPAKPGTRCRCAHCRGTTPTTVRRSIDTCHCLGRESFLVTVTVITDGCITRAGLGMMWRLPQTSELPLGRAGSKHCPLPRREGRDRLRKVHQ